VVYRSRSRTAKPRVLVGYGDYAQMPLALRPPKPWQESVGGSVGSYIGHGIHTLVRNLVGFGDYNVQENSIMSGRVLSGDPPEIRNTHQNSFIVRHREYMTDVYASQAFDITSYNINPGLLVSFPWLAQVADSFEQYKMRGLVYEFKSMSSDAVLSSGASSALGTGYNVNTI